MSADKLHIIVDSDDFSSSIGLDISFGYIAGFVIKQAMRVSTPSNTSHVNSIEKINESKAYSYFGG